MAGICQKTTITDVNAIFHVLMLFTVHDGPAEPGVTTCSCVIAHPLPDPAFLFNESRSVGYYSVPC